MPSSSARGVVVIKNKTFYVMGRFWHQPKESAKGFFNHDIFKFTHDEIWPEFFSYHLSNLNDAQKKDQPKSLFLESGLQIELADTNRDLTCRQNFRDFMSNFLIYTLSHLSSGDGFYDDLNPNETFVFVDYPHQVIYINGEKIFKKGTHSDKKPKDTPIMKQIKSQLSSDSVATRGIVYGALECLKQQEEIFQFYNEFIGWLEKYADTLEDRENPSEAARRKIGHGLRYVGGSTQKRWRNALDLDYESLSMEFSKFKMLHKILEV